MFSVTQYFVEDGDGGARGPFRERSQAGALAASAARRGRAVRVYAVTGDPMFDLWGEPQLLEAYSAGSVAAETAAPEPKTSEIVMFSRQSRSS